MRTSLQLIASAFGASSFDFNSLEPQLTLRPFGLFQLPLKLLQSHNIDGTKDTMVQAFRSNEASKAEGIPTFSDEDSDAGVFSPNCIGLWLCPECKEGMLVMISPYLASLITHYCDLHHKRGSKYNVPVLRLGMDLCNLLTGGERRNLILETAATKGWPVTNINF